MSSDLVNAGSGSYPTVELRTQQRREVATSRRASVYPMMTAAMPCRALPSRRSVLLPLARDTGSGSRGARATGHWLVGGLRKAIADSLAQSAGAIKPAALTHP